MVSATLLALTQASPAWVITFSQEFDGPAGTPPDPKVWRRDLGGSGFGNNEMQSYTDGAHNAFLDGKGHLVIEARKEPTKGADGLARDYSSARLLTKGTFSQAYGRFEARMKLPIGQGIWPAFWMMGDRTIREGWPSGGELDILEYLGHQPRQIYGTLHGPGYSGGAGIQVKFSAPKNLNEGFHTYGVTWTPEKIDWTFDGKVYGTVRVADQMARRWVFDDPFFLILNLAVGGYWPGYPDATTQFPQRLVVDYVRVYKDKNLKVDRKKIDAAHKARISKVQPFRDAPVVALPGTIELANYRVGGYKDSNPVNEGGFYRPLDGADIGMSGVAKPKYSIGWTVPGEWMEYEVSVATAGKYRFAIDAACEGPGGTVRLSRAGKPLTPAVTIPDTKGWGTWRSVPMGEATLPKGRHILRLEMVSAGPGGPVGNVMQLRVTKA